MGSIFGFFKDKEGDNQVHKSECWTGYFFSKYIVVLADVNNEFWSKQGMSLALWHAFLYPWVVCRNRRTDHPDWWKRHDSWSSNTVSQSWERQFHHFRTFHNILQDKWFMALRELKAVNFSLRWPAGSVPLQQDLQTRPIERSRYRNNGSGCCWPGCGIHLRVLHGWWPWHFGSLCVCWPRGDHFYDMCQHVCTEILRKWENGAFFGVRQVWVSFLAELGSKGTFFARGGGRLSQNVE